MNAAHAAREKINSCTQGIVVDRGRSRWLVYSKSARHEEKCKCQ